jgi:2-desacetyl-2-hydroxyethyl bacteriochlorophyllide A dehydrogenase
MNRQVLYFIAPGEVEVREEALPPPGAGMALVRVLFSAISPGTELLIYRGQFPDDMDVDENIPALSGSFKYPLPYGYAAVGRVEAIGKDVAPQWLERLVFAFQPHASYFIAGVSELVPLPEDITPDQAVFLPNMETAVNFVMDGAPLIGERVAVFGQGIVGLLTTALLARFPLASLVTLDRYDLRRQASLRLGAYTSLDPSAPECREALKQLLPGGADLVYELSGMPAALDTAIATAGFAARVVIGSWYGQKKTALNLGGRFHRSRIRLISSQVSSLAPELSARWTKARRFDVAWEMLRLVQPDRLITRHMPLTAASLAYQILDQRPQETIQIVFSSEMD